MDLGQVLIGLAGIALGYNSLKRGAGHVASGLRHGRDRVERDPGPRGNAGKTVGRIKRGGMTMELREVRSLDDRINAIRDRAKRGRVDPQVMAWTRRQVSKKCPTRPGGWCVPEKDTRAEVIAVFEGMRRDVRYTSDILGVDTFAHPRRTLEQRSGDCDDYSSLGCAALMSIGIPCRFKVVRTKDAQTWNHIYIQGGFPKHDPREWFSLDASVPVKPGWEVPRSAVAESRIFEVKP